MNPLTLLLLAGSAGGALFGGPKQTSFQQLQQMFGPGAIGNNAQALYSIMANSPQFRAALARTNIGGQNLGNSINAKLANSGLMGTGVGAVGSAMGESAGGFARENLVGGLNQSALDSATKLNEVLGNLWAATRQKTTPLQTLSGSVLGALAPTFLKMPPIGGNRTGFVNQGESATDWGT